jgi:hypothetical protein
MRKKYIFRYIFAGAILLSTACQDKYVPRLKSANKSYLVVEGFINNGADSTVISLSRAFGFSDTSKIGYELHALVYVEDQANNQYNLAEIGGGQYGGQLSLNPAGQYRVHIRSSAGNEYVSDYTPLKPSPPIDSINWTVGSNGLTIYANTHDVRQNTRYYRWEYREAWEFHTPFFSRLEYVNNHLQTRFNNDINVCYQSNNSSRIILASSARLATDVIYEAPIVLIPPMDWRLDVRYSILVKQYALTEEAFNYWQALQKNTEQLGSIFGPLPSEIRGNVHNLRDGSEEVLGYIGSGSVVSKRIFISQTDLVSLGWANSLHWSDCVAMDTSIGLAPILFGQGAYVPIDFGATPALIIYSTRYCVDCTVSGTNKKPLFWP